MIMKETIRLSASGYALRSKADGKARKTGKESTLKNTVSCVDNPGHFTSRSVAHTCAGETSANLSECRISRINFCSVLLNAR